MLSPREIESTFHITKLKLLEVGPLVPFLWGRNEINCIDVGGNTGLWFEAFQDVFGQRVSKYTAYEPMPGNLQRFSARLQNAMRIQSKVDLIEACVGDSTGEVTINFNAEVTTLASAAIKESNVGGRVVSNHMSRKVRQVTIDDELKRLSFPKVDLIKIDVEGYEWAVIKGAERSLEASAIDNVYFEFGQHQAVVGQNFQQFFEYFKGRGFSIYKQSVGRNYFGLNEIRSYSDDLEDLSSMHMILASRFGPSGEYSGPRVVGRIN